MRRRGVPEFDWPAVPAAYALRVAEVAEQPRLAEIEAAAAVLYRPYGVEAFFGHGVTKTRRFVDALALGRVWVAARREDDLAVGFALAEPKPPYAYLAELDVDPDHGQRGLGSALLETVRRWAEAGGAQALWLTTQSNIPWNSPFYERRGFRIVRGLQRPVFIRDILSRQAAIGFPMVHRVAMVLPLAKPPASGVRP